MTAATPDLRAAATTRLRVLVADDEESMRHFVQRGLARRGHDVTTVADGHAAAAAWVASAFDLAVLDLRMPGDGLATLGKLRGHDADAVVVLMTAHGSVDVAVEAMRLGAADFVTKPFEIDELAMRIERAAASRSQSRAHRRLRAMLQQPDGGVGLAAKSRVMRTLLQQVELVADSATTVLLTGESGTGKGLVARALHLRSPRAEQPFLALNCAAMPDTLVESELFGHEAGAFTGARSKKNGLLLRANGGTVLLDEVADMSLAAQAKIERFLVDREFVPLGATQPVKVDVRVIAATNRDLPALVEHGRFRAELLWRLDVVPLHVPPLRERADDLQQLVASALARAAGGTARHHLSADALAAMASYAWPGNVRELENVVERMVVLAGDRTELGVADLPTEIAETTSTALDAAAGEDGYEAARERFDRLYFEALLRRSGGSVTEAARQAGLSRGHLHRRLRDLGLGGKNAHGAPLADDDE
ncbi:MAG: sigma-54-dependent Fis family transcriptional regulator [Planctomycetes bacterium]|nr:sigma-54-dependent Fis family transcriptional regulator [Planctomycetota bacterium]